MRILLFEYTCGGGLAGRPDLASLRAEGAAMLAAIREDLARIPGVEVRTILDRERPEEAFREEVRSADAALVIAPESDGLLAAYCRWAEEAGTLLLGPSAEAVRLCGDKLALGDWLRERGVPVPECRRFGGAAGCPFPAVLKPRDGAGSQATFLVRGAAEVAVAAGQARAEGWSGEWVVQPFVPGVAASAAFLLGPRQQVSLPPAEQRLSADGRFHYLGGAIPLPPDLAGRAVRLARRAVEAVPGLRGYVGVDVVLGEHGDWVIEINPRLTTSYLGLRALAKTNLAEAMLRVATGRKTGEVRWRSGQVIFTPSGP